MVHVLCRNKYAVCNKEKIAAFKRQQDENAADPSFASFSAKKTKSGQGKQNN